LLNVREFGSTGPLLVILHGLFGDSSNWRGIAKKFSVNHHVLVVDLPAHGSSPLLPMDYENMAIALKDTIFHTSERRCSLLGHSMGGKTAMSFSLLFPNILEKLIIIDIAPKLYPLMHERIFQGMQAVANQCVSSKSEADKILEHFESNSVIRLFLLKNLLRTENGTYHWRIDISYIYRFYKSICSWEVPQNRKNCSFSGPALFMYGTKSTYIQKEDIPLIKSFFPNATFFAMEGSGHWPHAESPEQFFQITHAFLDTRE